MVGDERTGGRSETWVPGELADKSQELGEEFSRIEILGMYDRLVKGRFTRLDLKRGEPYAPGRARISGQCVFFDKLDQHLEDWYGFT
jgi:hypothetical protein